VKTGVVGNLLLGLVSILIYLPMVPLLLSSLSIDVSYIILYFVAAAQIFNLYLISALEACLRSTKPQAIGYGLIIEELCKITAAYVLIDMFKQPLLGAMVGLVIAVSVQGLYYVKLIRPELKQKVRWGYVWQWLKGSTANIFNTIGNLIASSVFLLLFIYGGGDARGNYMAAWTIAGIITYSSFLSFALYPKMLAENSLKEVDGSLKLVLMFAIPMTAGAMAIPESFLIILKDVYAKDATLLMILAIDAFVMTLSSFYTFVLFGVEKLDEEARIPLRKLVKSHIFKVFALPYFHALITITATVLILPTYAAVQPLQAAIYVAVFNAVARFTMFIVLYFLVSRTVKLTVPWKSISKYVFASGVMALTLFFLPHPTRLLMTFAMVFLGSAIYLALLLALNSETRDFVRSILAEIRNILGKSPRKNEESL
jgi:hypothetical protein